jgi:DNA-directed RNA polymerase subunit RPC12/RpoP
MLLFRCLRCRARLRGKQEWRGRKVRCPSCQAVLRLPRNREWIERMMYRSRN